MNNTTLKIEKGDIYTVTVADDTASVVSSAEIWVKHEPPAQETLHVGALEGGDVVTLGPYLDAANFRIQSEGNITIARVGEGSTPVGLFDQIPLGGAEPMAFIDDATDEVDVVTQFNALRDGMITAGLMLEQ